MFKIFYELIKSTYDPKYKIWFFLSPFIFPILGWILIFFAVFFLKADPQKTASVMLLPALYLFAWVFFMMFVRSKYYLHEGELKKIEYVSLKDITDKLVEEAKKAGFDVVLNSKTPWSKYEAKITGSLNGISFLVDRVHDSADSGTHLNSYSTFIYINTRNKEKLAIDARDIDSDLNSIKEMTKSKIISILRQELNWLMKENAFVAKMDFSHGSMGAIVCNEYNMASQLRKTLEILVKIVKVYDQN